MVIQQQSANAIEKIRTSGHSVESAVQELTESSNSSCSGHQTMHKPRILCFGDSNVWGYVSASAHQRHGAKRWTQLLSASLDGFAQVIEEGLNSRTICTVDQRPHKQGRNSMDYIIPCLDSHDPIDYIFLLLGTNELKAEFTQTPSDVAAAMGKLVTLIQNHSFESGHCAPKVVIISPPKVNETTAYCTHNGKYRDAKAKSCALDDHYKRLAIRNNCDYISASDCPTGEDGVHLSEIGHQILFARIEQYLTGKEHILQLAKSNME